MILDFLLCVLMCLGASILSFFCNDTATTEIYTYGHTLSLHDARPIWPIGSNLGMTRRTGAGSRPRRRKLNRHGSPRSTALPPHDTRWRDQAGDRKSTRLNSSH